MINIFTYFIIYFSNVRDILHLYSLVVFRIAGIILYTSLNARIESVIQKSGVESGIILKQYLW